MSNFDVVSSPDVGAREAGEPDMTWVLKMFGRRHTRDTPITFSASLMTWAWDSVSIAAWSSMRSWVTHAGV